MKKITLTVSAHSYNAIIQGLQELPWRLADPALREIEPQVRKALEDDAAEKASDQNGN